jgi:hypothetical protein
MVATPSFPPGAGSSQWSAQFWQFQRPDILWFIYDYYFSQMMVQPAYDPLAVYINVPQSVAQAFLLAPNPGQFYYGRIKNVFKTSS